MPGDNATRQAIADALHDALLQGLRAAGVEVLPYAELDAQASYQSLGPVLHRAQEELGTQLGRSHFVGGLGRPWYFSNEDRHLGLGTMLSGFSSTQRSPSIVPSDA